MSEENGPTATATIYSSQSVTNDYLTLKGIELRTGIEKDKIHSAIMGEVLDNAIDDMEISGVNNPQIHVTTSKGLQGRIPFLKIVVRNSVNPDRDHVFSKELLNLIYNPSTYYGSKRIYRINRGALGDASKLMLGAPYALGDSMNVDLVSMGVVPITLKTSTRNVLKTYHVALSAAEDNDKTPKIVEDRQTPSKESYTEVQLLLPYDDNVDIEREIFFFLRDYILVNTHIEFTLDVVQPHEPLHFPATQSMINSSKNLSNPHFYDLSEFRQWIKELDNKKDQTIYDILLETFRGANNLPKNDLTLTTVGGLQKSQKKIERLFQLLQNKIPAISEDPRQGLALMIPFDTKIGTRRAALEERLAYGGYPCDYIKYKQKYGYYNYDSPNGIVKYPYFFEVFIGRSKQLYKPLKVIQSINSKISNNSWVFGGPYEYETEKHIRSRNSIYGIFSDYGYSYDETECKKPNNIIIVNLISQRINYKSHGKSRIDHTPFAEVISNVIVSACKGGIEKDGKIDQIAGLRLVLKARKAEFLGIQDPRERKRRELSQSDIFYATRKLLIEEHGYTDKEVNREYITREIRDECAKLGVTREQIGIIAADRAQLYFNKRWYDVGLDEIETLVEFGTDMIIIEKEGIIMRISPYSDKNRIALLNTRGFLVEYASKLAKLASEKRCNISIVVDWDVSGLLIFMKLRKIIPGLKRIGVDFETVTDLGLEVESLEEEYTPNEDHSNPLKEKLDEALINARLCGDKDKITEYWWLGLNLDYLETKRIEINSITAQLGDNERFYSWIEDRHRKLFPDRDFTRSFIVPEYVKPNVVQELEGLIEGKGIAALAPQREDLQTKLSDNDIKNAFLFDRINKVLPDYGANSFDDAVEEQSRNIIENNGNVKPILDKIEDLVKWLKQGNGEGVGKTGGI
jgi:5S rRNA maturation endonuclease (ribonuclease M5)